MLVDVTGSPGPGVSAYHGSREPFAGWVVENGQSVATYALAVSQPLGAWTLTSFQLWNDARDSNSAGTVDAKFVGPEKWSVTMTNSGIRVARNAGVLEVSRPDGVNATANLSSGADLTTDRKELDEAFAAANLKYPRVRDLLHYRTKASVAVAFCALLQLAMLFLVNRTSKRGALALGLLAVPVWLGFAAWLGLSYLS